MSDEGLSASSRDVERIRDIIFGTQMRDYQERFELLRQDLARLRQEVEHLSERLAEQGQGHEQKSEALRGELGQAIDDLRQELRATAGRLGVEKVERLDLGRLLVKAGNRLAEGGSLDDLFEDRAEGEQGSRRDG